MATVLTAASQLPWVGQQSKCMTMHNRASLLTLRYTGHFGSWDERLYM